MMDRSLVGLAIVVAFGGGVGVGYALRGQPSDASAMPLRDDDKRPAPKPSIVVSGTPSGVATPPGDDGIAIADPIVWPSTSDVGFVWPTTIPPEGEVVKVDDTHYQVDRGLLTQSTLISGRVVPVRGTATTPAGVRLFAVRPSSPLGRVGFLNGDVIAYVDELALGSPDQALEAYAKVRSRSVVALRIVRAGKPLVLHYQITEAPKAPKPPMPSVVVPPKKP